MAETYQQQTSQITSLFTYLLHVDRLYHWSLYLQIARVAKSLSITIIVWAYVTFHCNTKHCFHLIMFKLLVWILIVLKRVIIITVHSLPSIEMNGESIIKIVNHFKFLSFICVLLVHYQSCDHISGNIRQQKDQESLSNTSSSLSVYSLSLNT